MSDYTQYDRVTDILMYFTTEITLNFTVKLSRKNINGERRFFHYEIAKLSPNRDEDELFNIKRNMEFFFTIDIKNDFAQTIILRPRDVQMLNDIITRSILPWYQSGTKEYAFQIIKGNLALKEFTHTIYTQSEVKYLKFEPCVLQDNNGKFSFGISMNISGLYSVELEIEKFMDFVYLLHSDMYVVACTLCNYAKMQPYGIGVYRPFGLGGGRVEDPFVDNISDREIQASYSSTTINSANREQTQNNFLNNSKSKTKERK